jgi:hypothetical protein
MRNKAAQFGDGGRSADGNNKKRRKNLQAETVRLLTKEAIELAKCLDWQSEL